MILPAKYRIGFVLVLIGIAALMLSVCAWIAYGGYGFVIVDAAAGASGELRHLQDLLTLQSAILSVAAIAAAFMAISLVVLAFADRRITRNAEALAASLKAYAAGDWEKTPHVHRGDALDEVAEAATALSRAVRGRETRALHAGGEAEGIKSRFLEIISHQLRSPLTAIRWNIESLLRGEEGDLNRRQEEVLRITDKNYQNVLVMLSDWVEALEVERGLLKLNPEPIDPEAFLQSVIEEFKSQAKLKRLLFRVSIAKGMPQIFVDKLKLHYIFSKLLHNAMSYTAERGRVTLRARQDGRFVAFEIEDSGVGIPPDEQPNIFKKFFRASNAALMEPNASGVGLFVTKTLVEAHGGEIGFTSVEGRGTVFAFKLPVSETPKPLPHAKPAASRRSRRPALPGRGRRRSA